MTSTRESRLFSPLTIRGVTFKNRIGVSPMVTDFAEDGFANDYHLVNYGSFATGGAGLVMVEATAVEAIGRITPLDLGIWKDEHVQSLAGISKFIKSQGAVAGIQLGHAGRKASAQPFKIGRGVVEDRDGGWVTVGPSAIPFGGYMHKVPREATIADINRIKQAYLAGAKRAIEAGFDLIELHFAHGFFVSSFLSPSSNQRRGKYGGSTENRFRLALEITQEVRETIPDDTVLSVRLSVTDYCGSGWSVDDSIRLAKRLKTLGVDLVDCSSGGMSYVENMSTIDSGTVQRDAARRIQQEADVATCAVGLIRDPSLAEKIISNDEATIVLLGRMFLNNPHWPYHAADILDAARTFRYPNQYDWCIGWQAFGKWRKFLSEQN